MSHAVRLAVQGRFNDLGSRGLIVLRFTPSSGGNLPDLPDPLRAHPLTPQLHGGPAHAELLGDRHIVLAGQGSQDNPAAQRHLLWSAMGGSPFFQLRPFSRLQLDRQARVGHERDHSNRRQS